jgi:hypothetical protein
MSRARRVVSPRIVTPYGAGLWFVVILLVLASIAGAFFAGVLLVREETKSLAVAMSALQQERETLEAELKDAKQEQIVLERTLQIEREASRTAKENLREAQDERLVLEKEATLLKRLIREGGGGVLKIQDVVLAPVEEDGSYHYRFTVTQMIQEYGESKGTLSIKLAGKRGGKEVVLPLSDLPGSDPASHKIGFRHFQNIEGTIKVPDDLEPEALMIEIKPTSKNLIRVTETLPWNGGV